MIPSILFFKINQLQLRRLRIFPSTLWHEVIWILKKKTIARGLKSGKRFETFLSHTPTLPDSLPRDGENGSYGNMSNPKSLESRVLDFRDSRLNLFERLFAAQEGDYSARKKKIQVQFRGANLSSNHERCAKGEKVLVGSVNNFCDCISHNTSGCSARSLHVAT